VKKPQPFDRYAYYLRAVQSPEVDCRFISDTYKELRGKRPRFLREDFCGTFAICCEWARKYKDGKALGIDLDREPLDYGRANYLAKLRPDQRKRVQTIQGSVLTAKVPNVDVVIAFNFSYYLFKSRLMLRNYFKRALAGLRRDGILIVDCFGGIECQESNEERAKIANFYYYWDQVNFDPVSNGALFHIHFKRKGEKKREKVFTYDWRMWTIPEIREAMSEAGFRKTHVYWEGTTRAGKGDGKFKQTEVGEECDSWIAYLVGER
jgi:SAM-dependent methyltransferase